MSVHQLRMKRSLHQSVCIGVVFAAILMPGAANGRGKSACKATAGHALKSCVKEAGSDYLLELGKASNLPTREERREAYREARQVLREDCQGCKEQYRARLDLCGALGEDFYHPEIDPSDFEEGQENPFFPLVPGLTRVYAGETEEGLEEVVVTVTEETREILGVSCTVVRDTAYLDGEVIEDTLDYYAFDRFGNAWYFGENSLEYEEGLVVSTHGSWIAGEDGAKPGIIMLASPQPGDVYRQEFALGEAEDAGEVLSLFESITVPYGSFTDCLQTEDFTPLEPDALEYKFYAEGIGVVKEVNPESGEELVLVDVTME